MNYWLIKSEPEAFSWERLVKDGVAVWDGVRNYQARNNLRKMKCGDVAFFYHSVKNPAIVGLATVTKEFYPDSTATKGDWSVVEIKPLQKLKREITLKELKQVDVLQNMSLIRSFRLSVQPVTKEEFGLIMAME